MEIADIAIRDLGRDYEVIIVFIYKRIRKLIYKRLIVEKTFLKSEVKDKLDYLSKIQYIDMINKKKTPVNFERFSTIPICRDIEIYRRLFYEVIKWQETRNSTN